MITVCNIVTLYKWQVIYRVFAQYIFFVSVRFLVYISKYTLVYIYRSILVSLNINIQFYSIYYINTTYVIHIKHKHMTHNFLKNPLLLKHVNRIKCAIWHYYYQHFYTSFLYLILVNSNDNAICETMKWVKWFNTFARGKWLKKETLFVSAVLIKSELWRVSWGNWSLIRLH